MLVVCLSSVNILTLFICDGRIGLCCVYVVFLFTYPHEFINRDIGAYKCSD